MRSSGWSAAWRASTSAGDKPMKNRTRAPRSRAAFATARMIGSV
jgi:hypothetical protein